MVTFFLDTVCVICSRMCMLRANGKYLYGLWRRGGGQRQNRWGWGGDGDDNDEDGVDMGTNVTIMERGGGDKVVFLQVCNSHGVICQIMYSYSAKHTLCPKESSYV